MPLRTADWTYSSGVTAVAETRLLTDDEFLDLLRLPTLQALLGRVKQVKTYAAMPAIDSPDAATRTVEQEFIRAARRFAHDAPETSVCELLLVKYLFAELRTFLRGKLLGDGVEEAEPGFLSSEELEALWEDRIDAREDLVEVVKPLRTTLEHVEDAAGLVDLLVDREELTYFVERARAIDSEFIRDWAETYVRLTAALTVIRARLAGESIEKLIEVLLKETLEDAWLLDLVDEERERLDNVLAQGFTPLEGEIVSISRSQVGSIARMMDDRLTLDAARARMIPFGPERLFGYLWGLHVENLNLRLITETFVVDADRDETRARLRRSYVG